MLFVFVLVPHLVVVMLIEKGRSMGLRSFLFILLFFDVKSRCEIEVHVTQIHNLKGVNFSHLEHLAKIYCLSPPMGYRPLLREIYVEDVC